MRILLFLLFLSPTLIIAGCGDCDEVHAEIEMETKMDFNYHACRNCKNVVADKETNCPKFGFVCEDRFYTNPLSATGNCECLEARCAPNAKLYVKTKIDGEQDPFATSKMRCNNSEWTVGGVAVETATCAKNCDVGGCKEIVTPHMKDFSTLVISKADSSTGSCATATCANGLATLKADGTLDQDIGNFQPPVETVTCAGDGTWTWNEGSDQKKSKRVMCIASPCGPLKCPAAVTGVIHAEQDVVPLKVTSGVGEGCASATCSDGFMEIDEDGNAIGEPNTDIPSIKCTIAGTWERYPNGVMCKQPECKNDCDPTPLGAMNPAIRQDCTYFCKPPTMLFRYEDDIPYSPIALHRATCESNHKYLADSTLYMDRIGCMHCPVPDGKYEDPRVTPTSEILHPTSEACVLSCVEAGFSLYYGPDQDNLDHSANRLYRKLNYPDTDSWVDSEHNQDVEQSAIIVCLKK